MLKILRFLVILAGIAPVGPAAADDVAALAQRWAELKYNHHTDKDRVAQSEALEREAASLAEREPGARTLLLQADILNLTAEFMHSTASLGKVRSARDLLVQAQKGLSRIHSGTVTVHARAKTPIPLDRTEKVDARNVPLSQLRLTRWTRNAHRVACEPKLRCVRGEVAVSEALRDLSPLLPKLPVDASSVHDAAVQVALRDHEPVYLKLTGKVDAGFLLGDVPFEVVLDLPRAT
jgi:hypothetical protein